MLPDPPGPRDATLGACLRRLRAERGWSISELARRAGLWRQTIRDLENDAHRRPATYSIDHVAQAFGLTFDQLQRLVHDTTRFSSGPTHGGHQPRSAAARGWYAQLAAHSRQHAAEPCQSARGADWCRVP
jgi:transcriptional regulator with XRE-family HTH domain